MSMSRVPGLPVWARTVVTEMIEKYSLNYI